MAVINSGMRRLIKDMAVACQFMQIMSLMPKPKDFVVRLVGDVVYLSASINKLSDDINKLLDSYAEVPTNYLMTEMNSITGSLMSITDRLSIYGQNAVNQTIGIGENATQMMTELTGSAIDVTGSLTTAVISLGNEVAHASAAVLSDTDKAEDIHDATSVILEWTENGFKQINETATAPLKKATQSLVDTRTKVNDNIQGTADKINDAIEEKRLWVESLIKTLREKMAKLADIVDTNFKDVTGMTSVSKGATMVTEALKESGNNSLSSQATQAMANTLATVIKNFSIGKMVFAFTGVLSQSIIVRTGLDQLPPIDFESMLCKIRDDMTISVEDLHRQYDKMLESTYNDYVILNDEMSNEPNYSSKNYDKFIAEYDERLKELRDNVRLMLKNQSTYTREKGAETVDDKKVKSELKSAIKEVQEYRKQIKNARQANTLKGVIGEELNNFKKELEYRCNTLKSDWLDMMNQYKKAKDEIIGFFKNGGSCDMFIEDCCDAINKDFDQIKELCSNLRAQLVSSAVKIVMPADIGSVVPNPVYKIADFWMDIKTIIKFIKDLITLILDIINNLNKLARIMLNGINNVKEILEQLFDILGLRWLMDLVQSIIDFFGENITNANELLTNTLSPVYFGDTEAYENTVEAFEDLLEGTKISAEGLKSVGDVESMLKTFNDGNDVAKKVKKYKGLSSADGKEEDIDKMLDKLEELSEELVAYKSPILEEVGEHPVTSELMDGKPIDNDVKFIGWHFFHPNLDHTGSTYYGGGLIDKIRKKIKNKIIKKASKTGHKKRGGVYKLHRKTVGKGKNKVEAYTAFYWYTYYTEDLQKDCFEWEDEFANQGRIYVDSVIQTQNGSIVQIEDINGEKRMVFVADNMVRKGDYVNVDGVRYKVR